MKANLSVYGIRFLVAFLLLWLLMLGGCKANQKTIGETIQDITTTTQSHIEHTNVNRAIIDSLGIMIGRIKTARPECDSITQAEIDRVLLQLNRYIQSGENSYRLTYDIYKKILSINTKIGQTRNTEITDSKSHDRYFITKVPVYIEKELTKEQKFNLMVGRGLWALLLLAFGWQLKKWIRP